ncbi:MAG: hypothetical protein PHU23_10985 [Dehalococcoidales bacterium]|nr:hypothetical protein [Dehalococcoidales bacterium]
MANVSRINGFVPYGTVGSSSYTGQSVLCYKEAGTTVTNDLFVGDPVVLSGTGDADGIPSVTKCTLASGNPIWGVVTGVKLDPDHRDRATWIDGADDGYVMVDCSLDTIYLAQIDEAIAITEIGKNCIAIQTAAGSRTAGTSGIEIDGTMANGANDMWKLIGFPRVADNTVNATYNKGLVIINNPQRILDAAGV